MGPYLVLAVVFVLLILLCCLSKSSSFKSYLSHKIREQWRTLAELGQSQWPGCEVEAISDIQPNNRTAMILSLISKCSWSIRHISLFFINITNSIFFQNEYFTPFLHNFILALVILLPCIGGLLWCCLAFDEWWMEEENCRGLFLRRLMYEEEEEARRRAVEMERVERMDRKER